MANVSGKGEFKLLPGYVLIKLPVCSNCKKVAPECRCGRPKLYEGR